MARRSLNRDPSLHSFSWDRPLVLFESDGWGRVGVRDKEGYELLRAARITLGQHPYDFYSLETAEDLAAISALLERHHDSTGRSPCLVMNFLTANLDFRKMAEAGFEQIHLLPLSKALPGNWKRPGLLEAYRQGISRGVFYPAMQGLTQFCRPAVEYALAHDSERRELLETLWRAETPFIYWRMPWVGYEYFNPEKPKPGFLPAAAQADLIRLAAEAFARLFKVFPKSASAPGNQANPDTSQAWSKWGIQVAQSAGTPSPPHFDEWGILHTYRSIEFEPVQRELPIEKYVQLADACFSRGMPAIVSMNSINFHSTLRNFRDPALQMLDQFLSALERQFPDLLYLHETDLYSLVTRGRFDAGHGSVSLTVRRQIAN